LNGKPLLISEYFTIIHECLRVMYKRRRYRPSP